MPTVEEILKQSGLTDDQIKALDAKIMSGFNTVLSTATAAEANAVKLKDQAELTSRAQQHTLETEINPALDAWATDKANLEAQVSFYRTQNEQARSGGFIPQDAPGYKPPNTDPNAQPGGNPPARGNDGRYVAGGNVVPGSPQYISIPDAYTALTNTTWAINEHLRLFGTPLPDEIQTLLQESNQNHLDFRTYVGRKYKFEEKRQEIATAAQKKHDDDIRKDERQKADKDWAEKTGNNPNVRPAESSQYSNLNKAVTAGQLKDPLSMSPAERHQQTRSSIQKDISERETIQ